MGSTLIAFHPTTSLKSSTATESQTHLISPTLMASSSTSLFVVDESNNQIIRFDNRQITAQTHLPEVKKLLISGDNLFALANNQLYSLSLDLTLKQPILFGTISTDQLTDISISGDKLFVLRGNNKIAILSLPTTSSSTSIENIEIQDRGNEIKNSTINQIHSSGADLILCSSTKVFKLRNELTENNLAETIYSCEQNETIIFSSASHILTSKNKLVNLTNSESVTLNGLNPSGFATNESDVFISSKTTHQVFKCSNSGHLTDLMLNPETELNKFSAKDFIHIKLTANAKLLYRPYSVEETLLAPSGTHLTVVAESGNFYYCLYRSESKNQFLYLAKSNTFETLTPSINESIYIATRSCTAYSLPSTITDSENKVVSNHPAGSEITVLTSSTCQNSIGELFFLVKIGDSFGFIRSNLLQSTKSAVQLTTACNAKTKRATTMFENADGTIEIIELKKGTRIALMEEISPTKNYVLAEFQDTNGTVFSGYIFTEDIDPDGLSTLQILGLVLVGANLTLLLTILIIRKRSRKWKVAPPPPSTPTYTSDL